MSGPHTSPSHPETDFGESLLVRFFSTLGWGTLIQAGLLLAVAALLVHTLAGLVRGLELSQLWPLVLLALPAGWLLGARAGRSGFLLGVVLGLVWVLLRTGSLLDETWRLTLALNEAMVSALRWGPGQPYPAFTPAGAVLDELINGSGVLLERGAAWLSALLGEKAGYDPVATALVWGFGVWLVLFWSAWSLRRGLHPLAAAGPGLLLMAASLAAANAPWGPLAPVLGITLLLTGLAVFAGRERQWERERVDFSDELRTDVGMAVIAVAVVLVAGAALGAYFNMERLNSWIDRLAPRTGSSQPPLGESLGLDRQPDPGPRNPTPAAQSGGVILSLRSGGLPRDHLLGTGPELTKEIVMWIATGDLPPGPPEMAAYAPIPRYYWRSLTYDIYTQRGWSTSQVQPESYPAGEKALITGLPTQVRVQQTITPAVDLGGLIYSAGDLASVDQPYEVEWRRRPDPYSPADYFGVSLSEPASGYRTESWYSQAAPELLRKAGSDYPAAIARRYLDLPQEMPDRVRQLALELTAVEPTPYDRALAIESYLRQNYTYSLDVDLPPMHQDVVDYFLFDLKAGYCDYYATSMVVLARLAGLPARLAIGYAPGTYNTYDARYAVSAAEAHSWPEVYFPGHGWVIFEPTVSQTPPQRSPLDLEAGREDETAPASLSLAALDWRRLLLWAGLASVGLLVLLFAWLLSDPLRLNLLPPGPALAALYARLENLAPHLGLRLPPGHTPAEFATALESVFTLQTGTKMPLANVILSMLSPGSGEAHGITELYARSVYSPRPILAAEKRQALRLWARLRWRVLLRRVVHRIKGKGKRL